MPANKKHSDSPALDDFESLVDSIVQIHHQAQDFATKAVNVGLTLRNWLIGHRIVEFEQNGKDRAAYGERLLPELAKRLASAGLKRVDMRELRRFRLLYTTYPQIRETVTPELLARAGALALQPLLQFTQQKNRETLSPDSQIPEFPAQPTPLATSNPPLPFRSPVSGFSFFFTPILQILSSCQKFTQNPKSKINNPLLPDQQIS